MDFVGINKLSLLDYPNKVSAILYTAGCNFRCPYCHNGLTLVEGDNKPIPFAEIVSFLNKRIGILDGVVISGGEPTLMPDLKEKIKAIREMGFCIKLDTNGTKPDLLREFINEKLIDYVAMDIKSSPNGYSLAAGRPVDMTSIKESIELLINSSVDYEFRTTIVDELHNDIDMISMGKMIKGAKKLCLQKFQVSEGVLNKNLHSVSEDRINTFKEILSKYVDEVVIRGY